ncbi:MAG: ABC transporter permease subunit, partial [Pseudomonadota bacterium]|nr:ABC transporter permease subunit [Pseudomonadota bacterium]
MRGGRGGRSPLIPLGGGPATAAQIALVAVLVGLALWLAGNVRANVPAFGFDFLREPAGFDIPQTLVAYSPLSSHGRVFIVGAANTLLVAALGIVLASAVGLLFGVMRLSGNFLARILSAAYVETARNTPLPIQLLVWFNLTLLAPPPRDAI